MNIAQYSLRWLLLLLLLACSPHLQAQKNTLPIKGLLETVQVIRDRNGVNHIKARNEHDLFFAQGYCAAKDRLFQFEIWRRQATGTLAEVFGSRMVQRDIGARLFRFQGDPEQEFNHYHPHGSAIIKAFTEGINACVKEMNTHPAQLPIEFTLLGLLPGYWNPIDVVSRHQGLLWNSTEELNNARLVNAIGTEKATALLNLQPGDPRLQLDPSFSKELLLKPLLEPYTAFRAPLSFLPADIINPEYRNQATTALLMESARLELLAAAEKEITSITGSNNWVISGSRTASGKPLLANDPHRAITIPSLRYAVHLEAPGWNVIGAGEPTIPGVSIGHNEAAAWGLTIFSIDGEDVMVYDLNPDNPHQYRYKNKWVDFTDQSDTIQVKDGQARAVTHHYTIHNPVTWIDTLLKKAIAIRCAWLEPGSAPYLASLRMNQCTSWEAFREACTYSFIPGENMIWADRNGHIGWQVVGIAPVRKNWTGLLPVPGDGSYEWDGFLPVKELPHLYDPASGFIATANENNVPVDYPHRNAVGWGWADSFRVNRIREVLHLNPRFTIKDAQALQTDYLSLPARQLVPLLHNQHFPNDLAERQRMRLLNWDLRLTPQSKEAAVYVLWEKQLVDSVSRLLIPAAAKPWLRSLAIDDVLHYLFSAAVTKTERESLTGFCFLLALQEAGRKLGPDPSHWQYGQAAFKHSQIRHILSNVVNDSLKAVLNTGLLPRGGYANTPGATGNIDNQSHGASFRLVVDLANWENAVFTNTPGQSGDAASPFYKNLFESWARDQYRKLYWRSPEAVSTTLLIPERTK